MRKTLLLAAAAALGSAGCVSSPAPTDLLDAKSALVEAKAAGLAREALLARGAQGLRVNDVLVRGFPAGPPGRLRFAVDIPQDGRFQAELAIDPRFQEKPGVEFVVKVLHDKREDTAFTLLVDPIAHPAHRLFVPVEVDLARFAGRGRELVLETRGYEETGDPGQAFWGIPALTTASQKAKLAILYLVDTLRADHTGVYGYKRNTTPELVEFAKDAIVFDSAISHASWTKPAVASILTSHLPGQHRAVQLRDPLDPSQVTIAGRFDERGFATGAAIANSVIYGEESAFDRGFDYFAGLHGDDDTRSKLVGADVVVDSALAFLRSRRGLPTFLYVHTMDPHVPYAPPPPFDQMFEPHATPEHPARDPRTDYKEPLDRERMIAQYDGDVAFGDREFGRFVRELKTLGLYDDALVLFMADHGEEFQDHGLWLHGRSLYDELIRIPLVLKLPGGRGHGARIERQVQGVDVMPTLLEAMGVPLPGDLVGRPLQRALESGEPARPALAEISHRGFVAHGVRTEEEKFVRRFSPDDDELLFDLRRDPGEKTNIAEANPERVRLRKAQVEAGMAQNPFRYVIEARGGGKLALRLETHGWLEAVETTGLGPQERAVAGGNGRSIDLVLQPHAGAPREISFTVRPIGAPVTLSGLRDGKPLRPADVGIGEGGQHPDAIPYRLPDVESETDRGSGLKLFGSPKGGTAPVALWLALPPGRSIGELDAATRERLRALGYVGPG
jgi:arylsulfatase A-like enzyme